MSVDLAAEMPFYQIHDYDLELELTTCKNRILKIIRRKQDRRLC